VRSVSVAGADFEQPGALDAATSVMPPDDAPQSHPPAVIPAAPGRLAATPSTAPPAPQATANRAGRAQNQALAQNRRHPAQQPRAKQSQSLFARMGSFFHRVNYRQNVNGSQRDEYSRP
jgi:hypothetical protein